MRVLDADNELLGVMPTADALKMAQEKGIDLVEISPNAEPPVCKLIEYGKYLYQKSKDQKNTHQFFTKRIQFEIPPLIYFEILIYLF